MKPSERIAQIAFDRYGRVVDGVAAAREIRGEDWTRATVDYLDEQQNLPRLAAAYCAHVLAACSYPGYPSDERLLQAGLEAAQRVGERLGVPHHVEVKLGDNPNEALARFATWLEKEGSV